MSNFVLTITGADDHVAPVDLLELSAKFEFVEWGILFSNVQGRPRYPSLQWRSSLYAAVMNQQNMMNLSAHLCGDYAVDHLETYKRTLTEIGIFYRRVQFNRFNNHVKDEVLEYSKNIGTILPYNGNTSNIINELTPTPGMTLLFDASGGTGVSPLLFNKDWPEHHDKFALCGYAGGISEANVESVLSGLGKRYQDKPFWIDLETGVRGSDNKFDIRKVERILKLAEPYYGNSVIAVPEPSKIILQSW